MSEELAYKSETFLTDGESVIYIGTALEPTWTPYNNYGRKSTDYENCKTYPDPLFVNNIIIVRKKYFTHIPGLWFQKNWHLRHFRPIRKELINTSILKAMGVKFKENE